MSKVLTRQDVSAHHCKEDAWIIIHSQVLNITTFLSHHPGGDSVLLDVAGRDASDEFEQLGHSDEAREMVAALLVGTLRRGEAKVAPVSGKKSAPKVDVAIAAFTTKSSRGLDLQVFVYVMLVLFAVMMLGLQRYL